MISQQVVPIVLRISIIYLQPLNRRIRTSLMSWARMRLHPCTSATQSVLIICGLKLLIMVRDREELLYCYVICIVTISLNPTKNKEMK